MEVLSKKILVASLGDSNSDPRPKRLIEYLKKGNEVYVLSDHSKVNDSNFYKLDFVQLRFGSSIIFKIIRLILLIVRKFSFFDFFRDFINGILHGYIFKKNYPNMSNFDLIVCHDLSLIDFAFHLKDKNSKTAKIIFDAREFYPKQFEDSFFFRLFHGKERDRLCKKYLRRCEKVLTVSDGLCEAYRNSYSLKPVVMHSAPKFHEQEVNYQKNDFIRAVHHGVANKNRQIEKMIKIFEKCESRYSLDLFLTGNKEYINSLSKIIKSENIRIKDPVELDQIIQTIKNYDLGICYFEPKTFNLKHCLPNKFFEYIQSRLAIFSGPSEEMIKIIDEYNCGIYSKEFCIDSCVSALNSLDFEKLIAFKEGSDNAAKKYNFENEIVKIFNT